MDVVFSRLSKEVSMEKIYSTEDIADDDKKIPLTLRRAAKTKLFQIIPE